ncbi:MAG: hypothetical protein A2X56_14850 [Nitrospirae bacterium GWC2_57_13]|jgi:membrane-associated phospholipid phosphatase|nr:MAG: hypothetical protein A2X56_14850 [Nitrospirae bacterium GWC2_57_13]OGW43311.1 MAG: hypothetical protein A2X57_10865 [Nitrospirae bacterium GWD2_57_8]
MRNIFKPVDVITLAFVMLLMAITALFFAALPHWPWQIARFALLVAGITAIAFSAARPNAWKPATYLHAFLPVVVIVVAFDSLGDLIPWIWPHYFDDELIRIDRAIFGVHPTVWMERFIHPVMTNVLQIAYISYYPMSITLGIVLIMKHRTAAFDEAVFGIVLCFYLSYVGYLLVPAVGPRFTLADLQTTGLQASSFTLAIQNTLNALEHNKTDAFPSGHTAVALMTLYYAWKFREKRYATILAPTVLALILATVYLRYHYVIDVIAGVLLTVLTIGIAPALYRRLSRKGPSGDSAGA